MSSKTLNWDKRCTCCATEHPRMGDSAVFCVFQFHCNSMIAFALGTLLCVLPIGLLYVRQVLATRHSHSLQCFLQGFSRPTLWSSRPVPRVFLADPLVFTTRSSGFSRTDPRGFSRPNPRVFSAQPSGFLGPALGFSRPGPCVISAWPSSFSQPVPRGFFSTTRGFSRVCLAVVWPSVSPASSFLQPRWSLWSRLSLRCCSPCSYLSWAVVPLPSTPRNLSPPPSCALPFTGFYDLLRLLSLFSLCFGRRIFGIPPSAASGPSLRCFLLRGTFGFLKEGYPDYLGKAVV